jgi:2-aminoadipate transaminase
MTHTLPGPLLAARAAGYHPSPVREVFDVSMRPGMISLAGGNPDLSALPLAELSVTAADLIATAGLEALQYGAGQGTEALQQVVVEVMAAEGNPVDPATIQITAGSQMALEVVTTLLCDPGDVVLVEGPTYVGAISVFDGLQVDVAHVAMDEDGLVPEALEARIVELRADGRTIKALYTVPNFHNPTGVTLSAQRRPEVVRICRDAGIVVIEDNPYGMLSFDGEHLPSLHQLDPDAVYYLGSFSKIFSPGLRVGWVAAPIPIRRRLQLVSEATTICPSVLSQRLVERYIADYDWQGVLAVSRSRYQERCTAVLETLSAQMPAGTSWTVPRGGFFTWMDLPAGVTGVNVMAAAIGEGVVFVPGNAFYGDGRGADKLRIAFSFEETEVLREGVRRLAGVVRRLAEQAGRAS